MKEKTLEKCARFISILLNVGCIIFGVLSVLLFAWNYRYRLSLSFFLRKCSVEAWGTAVQAGQSLSFGQCVFFFYLLPWESLSVSFLALI